MKLKIVELEIKDNDIDEVLNTYYLVNPDGSKLAKLKHMIEHRFDYQTAENLSDEAIEIAENICDNIWEIIIDFVNDNFVVLDVDETYEIAY